MKRIALFLCGVMLLASCGAIKGDRVESGFVPEDTTVTTDDDLSLIHI